MTPTILIPKASCGGGIKMTYWKADFDALVQETTAIAKSISVEPATNNSTALYCMM
jgi:hypothetical protein